MLESNAMNGPQKSDSTKNLPDTTLTWIERLLPEATWPYLRLSRIDRPIGTWLLVWPCWWSIGLAATITATNPDVRPWFGLPNLWLLGLFFFGAVIMRGAGCTYNDLIDRNYDAQVKRTAQRPIPSGQVSVIMAILWLAAQSLAGLAILLQMNRYTIVLAICSLSIVAIYPFMKRITWWPQLFLGLAFNYGALLGWTAVTQTISTSAIFLYCGGIAWTLGYDTIYALQDIKDDALAGIKSSARLLGSQAKSFLFLVYAVAIVFFGLAGATAQTGWCFWLFLLVSAAQLVWQIIYLKTDLPADCLAKFRSNNWFGWLLFAAIISGSLTA